MLSRGSPGVGLWLRGKLVLLLMLLRVSWAQCFLFHRLTIMMSRGFAHNFLCVLALSYHREVPAYGVVLHWCVTRCCVLLTIACLLCWLTRAFSIFCFFPVIGASFADAGRTGTPLGLLWLNLVV
jgi:hypothetical protein